MKSLLLIVFLIFFFQFGYAQQLDEKITSEEIPAQASATVFNFLELAQKQEAGLLPPQHMWKPKVGKHKKPRFSLPLPEGFKTAPVQEFPTPQVASPSPTTTFLGLDDNGTSIPPDVNGAVGPNHIMTTLNTEVCIRNKAGTFISKVTLDSFWGTNSFDPKILYDPYNNRWIFTACANAESSTSALLIAVSATNDPTGTWYKWSYDVDATNVYWFDYPSIGFNKDWIVVSGNMFPVSAGSYNGTKTYVFNKANLYANTASTAYVFNTSASTAFTLVPAITYDNTLNKIYLLEEWNPGAGTLRMLQLTGEPPTTPALAFTTLYPTGQAYSDNVNNDAPQSGSTNKIMTNDSRVQMVVYRNGSLWATHTSFLPATSPTRSAVQWWQINPTSTSNTGCVQQFGRVDDATSTNFFAFPSIAVNANSDVLLGFSRFSSSQFASANYAMRYSTDAANTLRDNIVFKAGEAKYFKDFSSGNNRWGDYTSTTIDPTNDLDFWTLQEYASTASGGQDRWGTYWAKLAVCVAPTQPSAFTTSTASVCQGASSVAYTVPAVAGATGYTWTYSGTGATITGSTNSVTVSYSAAATSGTLSVSATNSCGNSTARTLAITVNSAPAQPSAFTASTASVCQGASSVAYTVPVVSGATSYTWTYSGTGATITGTTNSVTVSFSPTATSGTLSVSATNSCGNSTARTLAITVNSAPAQPSAFTASTASVCQGASSVIYTVPNDAGATSYTWTYSGTGATITGNTNSVTVSYSAAATSGTLSVSATNSCGNSAARTLAVTVTATPAIPTTSASKLIICSGGSTTLSASGCAGTVTWSNGAGTGSSISVSPTSDISYTATCSVNSCLSGVSNSVSIKVIPQNLAVSSSTTPPFEAKDNITTTGNITISGTQTYKAGKSISLTSSPSTSISTAPGTVFTAKIEGCNY